MVADASAFQIVPDETSWAFFRNTLAGAGNLVPVESWYAIFGWTNTCTFVTIPNLWSLTCLWCAMAFAKIPVKIKASWANCWHADASTFSLVPGKPIGAIFRNANTIAESAVKVESNLTDTWNADTGAFFFTPESTSRANNSFNADAFT